MNGLKKCINLFPFFKLLLFAFIPSISLSQKPDLLLPDGKDKSIEFVCFSPDGKWVLSGSSDNSMALWDINNGNNIGSFPEQAESILSACFSSNGEQIISGSLDNSISIWDVRNEKITTTIKGKEVGQLTAIDFSNDGKWALVSRGYDLTLIDTENHKVESSSRFSYPYHVYITCICISQDSRYALIGADEYVILWDIQRNEIISTLTGHTRDITSVCFSPNGRYALSSSKDSTIKLWDIDYKNEVRTLKGLSDYVDEVSFSPDGRLALSLSWGNNEIKIWDVFNGSKIQSLVNNQDKFICATFSPDGRYVVSGGYDHSIILWNTSNGKAIKSLKGHLNSLYSCCFSPDGQSILSSYSQNSYILWDIQKANFINVFRGDSIINSSVGFYSDKIMGVKRMGKNLAFLDMQDGRVISLFSNVSDSIDNLAISPNGNQALSLYNYMLNEYEYYRMIKLWDIKNGEEIWSFDKIDFGYFSNIYFSSNGKLALLGDEMPIVLDVESGNEICSVPCFWCPFCFSPDGDGIFTFENYTLESRMKLWSVYDCKEISTSNNQLESVSSLCISPNGQLILLGSEDKTIWFWDVKTDKEVRSIKGNYKTNSISFSPDTNLILAMCDDNSFKLFSNKTGMEIASFYSVDSLDWLVKTPDQYYLTSKNASKCISWQIGVQFFSYDQFDLKYNRPDIVLDRIGYAPKELIESYRKAYQKRLKKMGFTEKMLKEDFHVPEIEIINKDELHTSRDNRRPPTANRRLQIKAWDTKYKLDRINVWVNDVPVYGMAGIGLRPLDTDSTIRTIDIELSAGNNKIQVSALNQAGAESLKETVYIDYQQESPVDSATYFVGIGVSDYQNSDFTLTYAAKDIRDMARTFITHDPGIVVDTLINKNVTRKNVLMLKNKLLKTSVNDKVILAISGHGFLSDSLDFYYGTWDIDPLHPETRGLAFDDIEWLLDSIPARKKLVFMDACHSGEVDKEEIQSIAYAPALPSNVKEIKGSRVIEMQLDTAALGLQNSFELMQELFTNLSKGNGASVISAAGGMQYAYEGDKWKNGVFSYSVLKGLIEGDADANGDKKVTVNELQNYVMKQVETLTGGRQKPTARQENLEVDWRVW